MDRSWPRGEGRFLRLLRLLRRQGAGAAAGDPFQYGEVQAARLGNTVEAVFYDASAGLETPLGAVTVSAPCALAAKFREGKVELAVADGRMNRELRSITVTVGGRAYTVELPSGELLGRQGTVAE